MKSVISTMGKKGDKHTPDSAEAKASLLDRLAAIDGITSKKMFGGHGIFHEGRMFGMVDSRGRYFLKSSEVNVALFTSAGAEKHGRMPYYAIPDQVLDDQDTLLAWAQSSIAVTK